METCAVLKDVRRKEKPLLSKVLELRPRDFARTEALARGRSAPNSESIRARQELRRILDQVLDVLSHAQKQMGLTKSDVIFQELGEKPDLPKPTNILTLIENRLNFSGEPYSARFYYEILSEMAHPNMMAFSVYHDVIRKGADGVIFINIEAKPRSARSVYSVLLAVVVPITNCIPEAMSDLEDMESEFQALTKMAAQLRHYLKKR
jgi:hypothetical protein